MKTIRLAHIGIGASIFKLISKEEVEKERESYYSVHSEGTLNNEIIINKKKNIPWVETYNIKKSRVMLNEMYNYFPDTNTLKLFLKDNCNQHLKEPEGDTGYSEDHFNPKAFVSNPNVISLPLAFNLKLINEIKNKAGVYTMYAPKTNKFYVESNTKFGARLSTHYQAAKGNHIDPLSLKISTEAHRLGGFNNFIWEATHISSNYYVDFVNKNPQYSNDVLVFRVLDSFTKYSVRILEQAIISFIKPKLNRKQDVSFPVNWSTLSTPTKGSRPVKAITLQGDIFDFTSVNKCATLLGISRKTIETIVNYPERFTYCKGINEYCRFLEDDLPLKIGNPYKSPYIREDVKGIDYNSLPLGKVVAQDKNLKEYAIFDSCTHAAKFCGFDNKYYQISRNINKSYVKVSIDGINTELLFVQNPLSKGTTKAVVRKDIITLELLLYSSVNDCVRALDTKIYATDFIKKYIKTGAIFENKYIFTYLSEYQGPTPKSVESSI